MIRVMIVDDEMHARALVREYLLPDERFEIVAECANGFEAVKAYAANRADLLFLDISMPKLDGFEVLDLLDPKPYVVFVTAHDAHAVRAFEVHAIDYILKPCAKKRFDQVLDRAARIIDAKGSQPIEELSASLRDGKPLQRILVKNGTDIEVIPLAKIDYFEAQDDYVIIVSSGKKHRKQQTLSDIERQIDTRRFIRVHRSYLLNIDRLSKVEPYGKDSRLAVLVDGTRIPISRSGYAKLRELL